VFTPSQTNAADQANFGINTKIRPFYKKCEKSPRFSLFLFLIILSFIPSLTFAQSQKPSNEKARSESGEFVLKIPKDSISTTGVWIPSPFYPGVASMPIYGDRTKPGFFVVRVKYPNGLTLQPHSHPNIISTIVLSGLLCIGAGEKWDDSKLKKVTAGQSYVFEPNMPHFEFFVGETVLQIHGIGPMLTSFLDSTAKPLFLPVKSN